MRVCVPAELVANWPTPLSPDVLLFAGNADDHAAHFKRVKEASTYVRTKAIDVVARILPHTWGQVRRCTLPCLVATPPCGPHARVCVRAYAHSQDMPNSVALSELASLSRHMHAVGVNVRYLALLGTRVRLERQRYAVAVYTGLSVALPHPRWRVRRTQVVHPHRHGSTGREERAATGDATRGAAAAHAACCYHHCQRRQWY